MGLIKQIFRLIKSVIITAIILAIILYPILLLKVNPITFYWDKIKILWETIKDFPLKEILSSTKNGGLLKS